MSRAALAAPAPAAARDSTRTPFLPLLLLAAAIVVLTALGIDQSIAHYKEKGLDRLQVIAQFKADQVNAWLNARRADARFMHTSTLLAMHYKAWRHGGDHALQKTLPQRLDEFARNYGYREVFLLDAQGTPPAGLPAAASGGDATLAAVARQAIEGSDLLIHGPYRDTAGKIFLDFVTTLGDTDAAVVLRVEPEQSVYPMLQSWPTASPSGEALLFRRDGDAVLFLNELRHRADSAVKLRLPATAERLLSAQALSGATKLGRLVEGVDYRDVPAMGVVQTIPGTDWFLLAKLDRTEVYAEALHDALWIGFAGMLALFVAATGVFIHRQRQQLLLASLERASEARYRTVLEHGADAVFVANPEARFVYANQQAAKMLGYGVDDLLARGIADIVPPDELEMAMELFGQLKVEGHLCAELDLRRRDGWKIPVEVNAIRLPDNNLYGACRDIGARRRTEAALRDSEQRFRNLFEHMVEGIAHCELIYRDGLPHDFIYLDVNPAFEQLTGLKNVVGRRVGEVIPGHDRDHHPVQFDMYGEVAAGGAPRHREEVYVDEMDLWLSMSIYSPKRGQFIVVFNNISERKKAELALRESEQRFHDIVEASADWVWEIDRAARYTYVSDSVSDLLGYAPAELVGKTPYDLMSPAEAATIRQILTEITALGIPFRDLEITNRHQDGSLRHVLSTGTPIRDAHGQLVGYRGLDKDVTEKQRAADAQRNLASDLAATLRAIPDLLFELDAEGRYIDVNAAQEELLAAPETQLLGRTVDEILPVEAAQTVLDALAAAGATGSDYGRVIALPVPAGMHWFELSVAKKHYGTAGDTGAAPRFIMLSRDITARKNAEAALHRQTEELARRNAELERFNRATVGRELDMIALKQQVNALSQALGRAAPFDLSFVDADGGAT